MSTKPASTSNSFADREVAVRGRRRVSEDSSIALRRLGSRIVGYFILVLLATSSLFPLAWMMSTSVRERFEVFNGSMLPTKVNFDAYNFVFNNLHIFNFFGNSLLVSSITVAVVVSLATLAGYAFAHIDFWGKELLFLLLLGTLMIPASVLILPLFLQLRDFNLIDTQSGLIIAYIGGGLAFSVFLMRSFFKTLPTELIDAARVDGASEFSTFFRVMLPLARPGIATVLIFQFMSTWNEFIYAATFVHTPELRTLQPTIFAMVGRYSTNWPALTAALTISVLPIIIVYIFMQRQFVAGLTAGAVKQ